MQRLLSSVGTRALPSTRHAKAPGTTATLVPSTVWRRKDLLSLYVGPRSPHRQGGLPSVIFIHSVPLTASAFPNMSTPTFLPWPRTPHQLPYATAELFSRILRERLGVYCRICSVTLESHLCIWKCIGSRYFCISYFPHGVFALLLSTKDSVIK